MLLPKHIHEHLTYTKYLRLVLGMHFILHLIVKSNAIDWLLRGISLQLHSPAETKCGSFCLFFIFPIREREPYSWDVYLFLITKSCPIREDGSSLLGKQPLDRHKSQAKGWKGAEWLSHKSLDEAASLHGRGKEQRGIGSYHKVVPSTGLESWSQGL